MAYVSLGQVSQPGRSVSRPWRGRSPLPWETDQPTPVYRARLRLLRKRRAGVTRQAQQARAMQLEGLGKFKLKKVLKSAVKVVKKVAAVAVLPILAPTAALVAPKLVPKLLKSVKLIGAKKAEKLTKVFKTAQKVLLPAAIAGAAFLIPGLGATTLTALKGAGGFLSKAGGGIMNVLGPLFGKLSPEQQQQAEAAIAAGQPPPANLPAEFLEAYMRAVTSQGQQHPEWMPPAAGGPPGAPEEGEAAPVAEAGIMGLGGTGTLIALGAAGLIVTIAMGGGNGRGRRRG